MPVRRLPPNASLEQLEVQASDLLKAHAGGYLAALQRLREFHPRFRNASDAEIFAAVLERSDALLAIAREHGFASWARIESHLAHPDRANPLDLPLQERIGDPVFRRAVELLDAGDVESLRAHLQQHPELPRQHVVFEGSNNFQNPSLLEFVARNPVRHDRLPSNIVAVAKVILDVGVEPSILNETLSLVATGSVPRNCRVQIPLIDLLCEQGADPDFALQTAVLLEEFEAAEALIQRGARISLAIAAGLGRRDDFMRLLPSSTSPERHLALTMAADFGHLDIVKRLLDAGENPNRYNPVGGHSHTTPLHQAAWRGHANIVRLLVERGARMDMRDIFWDGIPADWAQHGDRPEIEAYLRALELHEEE